MGTAAEQVAERISLRQAAMDEVRSEQFLTPHEAVEWAEKHPESALYQHLDMGNVKAAARQHWVALVYQLFDDMNYVSVRVTAESESLGQRGAMTSRPRVIQAVQAGDLKPNLSWTVNNIVGRVTELHGILREAKRSKEAKLVKEALDRLTQLQEMLG